MNSGRSQNGYNAEVRESYNLETYSSRGYSLAGDSRQEGDEMASSKSSGKPLEGGDDSSDDYNDAFEDRRKMARRPVPVVPGARKPIKVFISLWSVFPSILLFCVVSFLCVYLSRMNPITVLDLEFSVFGQGFIWSFPILSIFCAYICYRILAKLHNNVKEIRFRHIHFISGRWSFKRSQVEVPFEEISYVNVRQNLYERFCNIGTILVTQSSGDVISFDGIGNPHKYATMIYKRLAKVKSNRGKSTPPVH